MPVSKSMATPPEKEFIQLKDFLLSSSLSYTSYRRLRELKKTPKEYKVTPKIILLKIKDVEKWLANPPQMERKPAAKTKSRKRPSR